MTRKTFILAHPEARRRAMACVADAPEGWAVSVSEPTKKRIQEEKYHAQIGDIAKQTRYAGKRWRKEHMKRILVDEFAEEMRELGTPLHMDGESLLIPSEDGRRVIQLGIQTRDFWVSEASAFIEWLHAWGVARDVRWSDEARRAPVYANERVAA